MKCGSQEGCFGLGAGFLGVLDFGVGEGDLSQGGQGEDLAVQSARARCPPGVMAGGGGWLQRA